MNYLFVVIGFGNITLPFVKHFHTNKEIDLSNNTEILYLIQNQLHIRTGDVDKVIVFNNNEKITEIDF